ncbi:MAG TPA: serine/threonine-protein kinase [Aggregatilineales bacterium]|nr:protein kinase [Anaerolineales bacterium]HRE48921.1 serine/threonine-protein kinase [Aggregatilineales bacterium]
MDSLIGKRLGQYEIISRLGAGGMATVYRARQASVERDVAIKIIRSDMMNDPVFAERFRREANTIAKLSHPHIVKVFDYGSEGDLAYLVMELLEGGSLARLLRAEGDMPLEKASEMLQQVARALDVAHQQGIIHRDLKPDNILLDSFRNAFLTDFGVAKLLTEQKMTSTGAVIGTPAYIAPELWNGSYADNRSDLYALGVIVYEMLTGRVPHNGDTPYRMMHMHIYEDAPPATSINPTLPPVIDDFLAVALAKDPDQRFRSADHMATVFQAAIHSGRLPPGIVVPTPTGSQQMPNRTARSRSQAASSIGRGGAVVFGVVGVLTLAVIGLLLSMSGRSTPSANPTIPPSEVAVLVTDMPTMTATATYTETATYTFTPSLTPTEAPNQETLVGVVMATLSAKQTLEAISVMVSHTETMTITPTETPDILATAQWIVEQTATGNALRLALMATKTPTLTATATNTYTPTPTPTESMLRIMAQPRTRIRMGPGTNYLVLAVVETTSDFYAFAKVKGKDGAIWYLIDVPNLQKQGWISEDVVEVSDPIYAVNLATAITIPPPPLNTRTATPSQATLTSTPDGANPLPTIMATSGAVETVPARTATPIPPTTLPAFTPTRTPIPTSCGPNPCT